MDFVFLSSGGSLTILNFQSAIFFMTVQFWMTAVRAASPENLAAKTQKVICLESTNRFKNTLR